MTLLPDRCSEKYNVYHVNIQNFRDVNNNTVRFVRYTLCAKERRQVSGITQGARHGVRPYAGDVAMADRGIITFGDRYTRIPVNMDQSVYLNLGAGAIASYWTYNMDDRDRYHYKRVYLVV